MKLNFILTGLVLSLPFSLMAQTTRGPIKKQVFQNSSEHCVLNTSCELKEFRLETHDYRTMISGSASLGSSAIKAYKTDKVENLEKFAIVQFIKGCVFSSSQNAQGEVEKRFGYSREFFDSFARFQHKSWVIDSIDSDPMYNNLTPDRRHGAYRWNKVRGSYDRKTEVHYFREKPIFPELYVSDLPGSAFLGSNEAKNISLKFKACIYQTEDIPLKTTPDDLDFATPIHCFDWASSFIYNHKLSRYESPSEIDSFCEEDKQSHLFE